jgi:hypothetical protein
MDRQHNDKKEKDKQRSTKHTHKTKDRVTRTTLKAQPFDLIWIMVFIATFNNIADIYCGGQFSWWRKSEYPVKNTDLSQVTDKTLSHINVSSTPLPGGIRTHNISVDRQWLHR